MKQGMGSNVRSGGKVEPKPRAISPAATADIGIKQLRPKAAPALYQGRGYKAPMHSMATHKSGSQGKH